LQIGVDLCQLLADMKIGLVSRKEFKPHFVTNLFFHGFWLFKLHLSFDLHNSDIQHSYLVWYHHWCSVMSLVLFILLTKLLLWGIKNIYFAIAPYFCLNLIADYMLKWH